MSRGSLAQKEKHSCSLFQPLSSFLCCSKWLMCILQTRLLNVQSCRHKTILDLHPEGPFPASNALPYFLDKKNGDPQGLGDLYKVGWLQNSRLGVGTQVSWLRSGAPFSTSQIPPAGCSLLIGTGVIGGGTALSSEPLSFGYHFPRCLHGVLRGLLWCFTPSAFSFLFSK